MLKKHFMRSKKKIEQIKHIFLNFVHDLYFRIKKLPALFKYISAIVIFLLGILFLMTPVIPGWIFVVLSIGLFSPELYSRRIGKHVRTKTFQSTIKSYGKKIHFLLDKNIKSKLRLQRKMLKKYKKTRKLSSYL